MNSYWHDNNYRQSVRDVVLTCGAL